MKEDFALVGGIITGAFALVRYTLHQNRLLTNRFTGFLESLIRRQEDAQGSFSEAILKLNDSVQEQSRILQRLGDRNS